MSFIGDLLRAGIETDGSKVQVNNRLVLKSNTKTGAASTPDLEEDVPVSFLVTNETAGAFSLEDGQVAGQVKIAILKTKATNDAVITPANFGGGTNVTLGTAGEGAIFVFDGTSWQLAATYSGAVA